MPYFVYILDCKNNGIQRFYTGMTKRPKARYSEHKRKRVTSTKRYNGNVNMVYLEMIDHRNEKQARKIALKREKQIKRYSSKKKRNIIKIKKLRTLELISIYINATLSDSTISLLKH